MKYQLTIFAVAIIAAVVGACEAKKVKHKEFNPAQFNKDIPKVGWSVVLLDTMGNVIICYQPGASSIGDSSVSYFDPRNLKAKLVNGRWEVDSELPVRIKLKDGYLENNGDSIVMGFEYGDIAKDFDDLVEKVKAKKRRGESWFVGTPLSPAAADYLMRMVEEAPDTSYVKALKNPAPKIEWRVEKEWSEVARCSVVVKKYYETPDSSTVIYFENPDSLHRRFMSEIKPFRPKMEMPPDIVSEQIDTLRAPVFESNYPALEAKGRVRSMLDPRDYSTVQEWRVPEEIVADQKWLDSFFARLDSVLADTTKKP